MNLKQLIQRVRNNISPAKSLDDEVVLKFVNVLEQVRKEEITCREIHTQLDEFVDEQINKKDADRIMPLIREHLDLCPDCCEEYEALLTVLEHTQDKKDG